MDSKYLTATQLKQLTGTRASTWRYWASIGEAEINRIQRQRLAYLMAAEVNYNGAWLSPAERQEMAALQQLGGIAPDAPLKAVKAWAGMAPDTSDTPQRSRASGRQRLAETRSMTPRQRIVETLGQRWPKQPLSGKDALLELYRAARRMASHPEAAPAESSTGHVGLT